MTIGNALTFIKRGMIDEELREKLNTASNMETCDGILAEEGLGFSRHDFEEAYHNQLTLCQTAEQADRLKEFKLWWELLSQLSSAGACNNPCGQCCG